MLYRHGDISVTFVIFDVLTVDGRDVTRVPYFERRRILASLVLRSPQWWVPEAFEDGHALWGCSL